MKLQLLGRSLFITGGILVGILLLQYVDYRALLILWTDIWQWGTLYFRPIGSSLEVLALPALVWFAFAFLLKEIAPKPTPISRVIVSLVTAFWGLRYLLWRLFSSLNLDDPLSATVSISLFGGECLSLLNSIFFYAHTIFQRDRSPEADEWSKAVIAGEYLPSVDVLIPTYNEGIEILTRTVIGCQAMDYPNKTIYLLDDTRRPAVRELAKELGCEYRDRPDNRHAKAGNINHALPTIHSELIAIFDADFVPSKNFLTRTVGFFQDPKTALVQTPQNFFNEDPVSVNLGLEGVVNNEQTLFFRYIQPSRDFLDAVVCCGSCFVMRRSALDEIGGIPTDSITEDYFTSLKMQSLGYKVKYLNEALSAGLAPETIGAFVSQRLRWGQGTLQLLFSKWNFFTIPNLKWWQRLSHSLSILYWLLSIPRVMFLFAPLLYLLFDIAPLRATINDIVFFYLPYYLSGVMCFSWLTENRRSVFWSDVYDTIMCLPLTITIVKTFINPRNKPFKVTPKGDVDPNKIRINWILIRPLLAVMILSILGLFRHGLGWTDRNVNSENLAINIFWTTYNCILLTICILAAIDVPQRRYPRFRRTEACKLQVLDQTIEGQTVDLSEGGALVQVNFYPYFRPLPGRITFVEPSPLAGITMPVIIEPRRQYSPPDTVRVGVKFLWVEIETLRQLIPLLYCQPYQWEETQVPEVKTLWGMFISVLRLYPLTFRRSYTRY
ncbi:MAG: glycosyltransferase family 2 protein [Pseudanabaenaceae cyanobacterium]